MPATVLATIEVQTREATQAVDVGLMVVTGERGVEGPRRREIEVRLLAEA